MAESWPRLAKLGPSTEIARSHGLAQSWSESTTNCCTSRQTWSKSSNLAEAGPNVAELRPTLVELAQISSNPESGKCWPSLPRSGIVAAVGPNLGRTRPNVVEPGPKLNEIGQAWSTPASRWWKSSHAGAGSGQIRSGRAQVEADGCSTQGRANETTKRLHCLPSRDESGSRHESCACSGG